MNMIVSKTYIMRFGKAKFKKWQLWYNSVLIHRLVTKSKAIFMDDYSSPTVSEHALYQQKQSMQYD